MRTTRAVQARGALPWPLTGPAAVAAAFLLVPLVGLLVRAPWCGLPRVLAAVFTRVTLPLVGNFPGRTQTMPLAVYLALESDPEAAIALSLVLLLVSVAVLTGLRDRWLHAGSSP